MCLVVMTPVSAVEFPKGPIRAYCKILPQSAAFSRSRMCWNCLAGRRATLQGGLFLPSAEGATGQSVECAVSWGGTWAGVGWHGTGEAVKNGEGKRYFNPGVLEQGKR